MKTKISSYDCLKFVVEFISEVMMFNSKGNEFKDETSQVGFSVRTVSQNDRSLFKICDPGPQNQS